MFLQKEQFNERLVDARPDKSWLLNALGGILVIITAITMFLFLGFGIILAGLGIFWLVMAFKMKNMEYEYTLTNGDIDVAKIVMKSSRKHILSIQETDIRSFDYADSAYVQNELDRNGHENNPKKVYKLVGKEPEKLVAIFAKAEGKEVIVILDFDNACIEHMNNVLKSRSKIKL